MKKILKIICIVLIFILSCAPAYKPPPLEVTGVYIKKPTPEALKHIGEKLKKAEGANDIVSVINLATAGAQVAFSIGDYTTAINLCEKGLKLTEYIKKQPSVADSWLKNWNKNYLKLSSEDRKLYLKRFILKKRQGLLNYLISAAHMKGYVTKVVWAFQENKKVEKELSQLPDELYFMEKFWGKLFVKQMKKTMSSMNVWFESTKKLNANWYKLSYEEREKVLAKILEKCRRNPPFLDASLLKEMRALEVPVEWTVCDPYFLRKSAHLKITQKLIENEVKKNLAFARWATKTYPSDIQCRARVGYISQIFLIPPQELSKANPKFIKEALDVADECIDVSTALKNPFYLANTVRIMEMINYSSQKIEKWIDKVIEKEEKERLFLQSEVDRRCKTAELQKLIDAAISYYFSKGQYEKALSMALRVKSRILLDLILGESKVEISKKSSSSVVVTSKTEHRGIVVRTPEGKIYDLEEIRIKGGAKVPELSEIFNSIPEDTVLLETYISNEALYLWLLNKNGIMAAKKIPVSKLQLADLIWKYREKLAHKNIRQSKTDLNLKATLKNGIVTVYAQNLSAVVHEILYLALKIGKSEIPVIPKCSYISSFEEKKIAEIQPENVFGIKLVTDYSTIYKTFVIDKNNVIEIKNVDSQKRKSSRTISINDIFSILAKLKECKKLIISPHGVLWYFPFSTIKLNDQYLIEKLSIVLVPSSAVLPLVKNSSKAFEKIFVFADPYNSNFTSLPPLPGTRKEAYSIKEYFPSAVIFLGSDAKEETFKKISSHANILHLATHGIFSSSDIKRSFLLLAPSKSQDGKLTTSEILELSLFEKPLVVLSACESGLTYVARGEELLGLSQAFLSAGASGVVSTLWKIHDEAAKKLIEVFYKELRNKPVEEALRQAQLSLIKDKNFSDPIYWGAFFYLK